MTTTAQSGEGPGVIGERSRTLVALWRRVNELAGVEDTKTIRLLIAEAGITPGMHVGTEAEDFDDDMVAEWVLGQWADMIDNGGAFLNSARNISYSQFEKLHGPVEAPAGGRSGEGWHLDEIRTITQRIGKGDGDHSDEAKR